MFTPLNALDLAKSLAKAPRIKAGKKRPIESE